MPCARVFATSHFSICDFVWGRWCSWCRDTSRSVLLSDCVWTRQIQTHTHRSHWFKALHNTRDEYLSGRNTEASPGFWVLETDLSSQSSVVSCAHSLRLLCCSALSDELSSAVVPGMSTENPCFPSVPRMAAVVRHRPGLICSRSEQTLTCFGALSFVSSSGRAGIVVTFLFC